MAVEYLPFHSCVADHRLPLGFGRKVANSVHLVVDFAKLFIGIIVPVPVLAHLERIK